MARYVVTGAAGFIGSRVASQLLAASHEVIGIDNLNDAYDVRLKEFRLRDLCARDNFHFHKADIAERAAVENLFRAPEARNVDAIVNLAARAGVRPSVIDPWVYFDTNATGTLNLLAAAREHGVPKFVLASTSSLYGADNPMPYAENANTDRPLSPYAASKKAAEAICYTYHYLYGLDVSVLRYFTVYGPAGRPDMSLFRFVQWVSEGRPVIIFGDGTQQRDFTYVEDVAAGTVSALRPLGYEIINLGSDRPIELAETVRVVEELTGKRANIEYRPRHPADVLATWADISKAERLLGWRPAMPFADGVRNLVEWYRSNREWAKDVATE
jgi:nucleoside-diphosphate-sugar epimerase